MRVARLKLANVRAIEAAEFNFNPGFNLIVGVNGVGKTTVLDALGVCLSSVIRDTYDLRGEYKGFNADDIRAGSDVLNSMCEVWYGTSEYPTYVTVVRDAGRPQGPAASLQTIRGDGIDPDVELYSGGSLLAALFSSRRASIYRRAPLRTQAAGGIRSAVAQALANRELNIRECAEWMYAQQEVGLEHPAANDVLAELERTVSTILPGYSNLRAKDAMRAELLIDHGGIPLNISQLSDGERSIFAMVFDLTRRLVQANPSMVSPTTEAEAVVLIDELELHLHPKWQRHIIAKLRGAFPRCQFIATTHSPQIIGELDPDSIHIISDGEVYSPIHSYGVDSGRILEEIMDTDSRTEEMEDKLARISRQIDEDKFKDARNSLRSIADVLGENDPDVVRLNTLISFMEGDE